MGGNPYITQASPFVGKGISTQHCHCRHWRKHPPRLEDRVMAFCGCSRKRCPEDISGLSSICEEVLSPEMVSAYKMKGREAWEKTWDIFNTITGWKNSRGTDLTTGIIHYQNFKGIGKIFRLQGILPMAPMRLFNEITMNVEQSPKWNTAVLESRIIEDIDEDTDICHNISADAAGGLVAKRDFVSVRHWRKQDGVIISASCGVEHPRVPPSKNCVRGINKPGGWVFAPHDTDPDLCVFSWFMGTDLKIWLPQTVLDRVLSSMLLDFFQNLRKHIENDSILVTNPIKDH